MYYIYAVAYLLVGASAGSFLNVVAWRIPRGESIVSPGSRCTSCGSPIKWYDNVPVLSWFLLGGKCRNCRAHFSIRYAMVELAAGLIFLIMFLHFGPGIESIKYCAFSALLLCATLTDLDHWLILDSVSIGGTVLGLAFSLLPNGGSFIPALLAAAGGFLLFLIIRLASIQVLRRKPGYTLAPEGHEDEADEFQGGMGWGDVKLAAMIGAFLGPSSTAVAFFAAFLTGAVIGTIVMIAGRSRRIPVPFGPFMALGAIISVFAGEGIWAFYLRVGLNL